MGGLISTPASNSQINVTCFALRHSSICESKNRSLPRSEKANKSLFWQMNVPLPCSQTLLLIFNWFSRTCWLKYARSLKSDLLFWQLRRDKVRCREYRHYWILWLSDSVTYWIQWLFYLFPKSCFDDAALSDSVTYWILWLFRPYPFFCLLVPGAHPILIHF